MSSRCFRIQSSWMMNWGEKLGKIIFTENTKKSIYEIKNHSNHNYIHGEINEHKKEKIACNERENEEIL